MAKTVPGLWVAERIGFALPNGATIDREKGVISDVRLLGPRSRNGIKYPASVLEKHLDKYAAPSFIGHQRNPLTGAPLLDFPPEKKFGRTDKPRIHDGGINGVFRFNPEHPFAKPFVWAVENDPKSLAFSAFHRPAWLNGGVPDKDGDRVAESILQVVSIDVVDDGGTTSGIFETFNQNPEWVAEMIDVEKIAGELETDGAWVAFLTDLAAKMKGLAQTTKDAIMGVITAAMSGSAEPPADAADGSTPPDAAAPAMEALRRYGKLGQWAARKLDALFVAEAAKKRTAWAESLIKAEAVPTELVTPLFAQLVAESFGNEARAKEMIADRKRLVAASGSGKQPHTAGGSGKQPTVEELVNGYVAG